MFRVVLVLIFTLSLATLAVAQLPPVDMDLAKGYVLGAGDEVTGKVVGEEDFNFIATVDEDGRIEVPFSETPLYARCLTVRQLRLEILDVLKKYLKNPQLGLSITQRKSRPPATIYGEVRLPQQIELMRKATLVELLAISGGPTEDAGGMIQVFRTLQPQCSDQSDEGRWLATTDDPGDVPSRLYSMASVRAGREEANPVIYPGDVILIQKAAPVYITGEVIAPQGIYLKEGGTSLTEALAKIGGVRPEAQKKNIKIHRLKSDSKEREIISANYDQIAKGLQPDVMLQPYDIVVVDKAKESIAQAILKVAIGAGKATVGSISGGIGYRVLY
jgi:polysaccharide biosynthesis/export protein